MLRCRVQLWQQDFVTNLKGSASMVYGDMFTEDPITGNLDPLSSKDGIQESFFISSDVLALDANLDGFTDLFLLNGDLERDKFGGSEGGFNELWLNSGVGDGRFLSVPLGQLERGPDMHKIGAVLDIDADGDDDVLQFYECGALDSCAPRVFVNDGTGAFSMADLTQTAALPSGAPTR